MAVRQNGSAQQIEVAAFYAAIKSTPCVDATLVADPSLTTKYNIVLEGNETGLLRTNIFRCTRFLFCYTRGGSSLNQRRALRKASLCSSICSLRTQVPTCAH